METRVLIDLLSGLGSWVMPVFSWLGLLIVVLRAVVRLTPTGKDDLVLEKIDSLPVVGPFLAGVASKAPLKKK